MAPLTAAILGAVAVEEAGIGSAVNNAVAGIAGLVAISCAGLIARPAVTTPGLHNAMAVTAALLVVGALTSAVGIRDPRGAGEDSDG